MGISESGEGMSLPGMKKVITQENIDLYAQASKDFNPIHVDPRYAAETPLGGTVAHGMLILAYVSQMMTAAFHQDWLSGGNLEVRFRGPARPGDTMTLSGKVSGIEKHGKQQVTTCDVLCTNQDGDPIVTGEAKVKHNEDSC